MVIENKVKWLVMMSTFILSPLSMAQSEKVSTVNDSVCYSDTNGTHCDDNHIVVDSDSETSIYGNKFSERDSGHQNSINNNSVVMTAGNVKGSVTGGYINATVLGDDPTISTDISGNRVDFSGGTLNSPDSTGNREGVFGGSLRVTFNNIGQVNMNNNSINISGGTIYAHGHENTKYGGIYAATVDLIGASIDQLSMTGNQISISDGSIFSNISAVLVSNSPMSGYGHVTLDNNLVNITGGNIEGNISGVNIIDQEGGFDENSSASMNNNQINISGGNINGNIAGSSVDISQVSGGDLNAHMEMNNNKITISGGKINGDIFGGLINDENGYSEVDDLTINNNIITLAGGSFAADSRIFGGYINGPDKDNVDLFTGNTLNFAMSPISIKQVGNFQYYNFYFTKDIQAGDTLISTTETNDLTGSEVKVVGVDKESALADGDEVTLINHVTGDNITLDKSQVTIGTAKLADITLDMVPDDDQGNDINAHIDIEHEKDNPQTQTYLSGQLSAGLFVHEGSEIVADYLTSHKFNANNVESFVSLTSGHNHYKTEGNIKLQGEHLLVGVAKSLSQFTYGAFGEGGWGSYNSDYNFESLNSIDSNGNVTYGGGGLFAYYHTQSGVYFGGLAHVGHVSSTFATNDFGVDGGVYSHYDSGTNYYAANIEAGQHYEVTSTISANMYARYLWTYLNGLNTLATTNEQIHFDGQDLSNLKAGVQLHYQPDSMELMLGLAYSYGFSGTPEGTIDGNQINNTSVRGGIFMVEPGIKFYLDNARNFSAGVNIQGYLGRREGLNGLLNIQYRF